MKSNFLLYGASGFVGKEMAKVAVEQGLNPILAGRTESKVKPIADELGLEYRIFDLSESDKLDAAIKDVVAVLHCAGPYVHTYKAMAEACLRQKTHYMDITGEIPVFEAFSNLDDRANSAGIMMMPGVGFDVVPTDCLAVHLKKQLPDATHLTLGFQSVGHAGFPPGTMKTMVELIPFGNRIRKDGKLIKPPRGIVQKTIDFGAGETKATRLTWGDVFTAHFSTGIPNIEVFSVFPPELVTQMTMIEYLRPIFSLGFVQNILKKNIKGGSSAKQRAKTSVYVWGEVTNAAGNKVEARLRGPEAGVIWTCLAALAATKRVLAGDIKTGYRTPAGVWGADFVLECEGVTRD